VNARQRRGVFLMTLAVVGAVALSIAVFNYVQSVSRQVGPMVTAYRFGKEVPRLGPITKEELEQVKIPAKWLPETAIQSFDTTRGLVAVRDIAKGSLLQEGMAGPPPELEPGEREIAILINAETGVAGRIQPADLVDIYATFADSEDKSAVARVIVSNAEVLAIGELQRVDAQAADTGDGGTRYQQNDVVPVTFALTIPESLQVAYAESFGVKVRLALIAPGTRSAANPQTDVVDSRRIFSPPAKPTPSPTKRAP
jgi:pilus assembly protein CpaB